MLDTWSDADREILGCPRCMHSAKLEALEMDAGQTRYSVICTGCRFEGNTMTSPRFGTKEEVQRKVIDDWNRLRR